jgi:hypothetical protein
MLSDKERKEKIAREERELKMEMDKKEREL